MIWTLSKRESFKNLQLHRFKKHNTQPFNNHTEDSKSSCLRPLRTLNYFVGLPFTNTNTLVVDKHSFIQFFQVSTKLILTDM